MPDPLETQPQAPAEATGTAVAEPEQSGGAERADGDATGASEPETGGTPAPHADAALASAKPKRRLSLMQRIERFLSWLSSRNNFFRRLSSLIWLPYAFRSGITMKRIDDKTYHAVLPFKRFNRNWYNAMAGAALLGNSEIAGGTYVFGLVGTECTVVCKKLEYTFLRPCFGPALYRIEPREDVEALLATGKEFNITVDMNIVQALTPDRVKQAAGGSAREKRVGRATAVFHVTPKAELRSRGRMGLLSNHDKARGS